MNAESIYLEQWCKLVAEVLRKHVPGKAVWAFGSRATGRRVKRFSDLDLAVEGRLNPEESFGLEEDFDESRLPIRVDVVELEAITPQFRARIEKGFVLVQEGAAAECAPGSLNPEHVSA